MLNLSKFLLIIFLLCKSIPNYGQSCEAIRNQKLDLTAKGIKPYAFDNYIDEILDSVGKCITITDLDRVAINREFFGLYSMTRSTKSTTSYGDLIDFIEDYKSSEVYQKNYKLLLPIKIFGQNLVNKKDWKLIRTLLLEGYQEPKIDNFKSFMYSERIKNFTNEEAYLLFILQEEFGNKLLKPETKFMGDFVKMPSLGKMLGQSKSSQKNICLFFTGFFGLKENRTHQALLVNDTIRALLQKHYLGYIGFVDNQRPLSSFDKQTLDIQEPLIDTEGDHIVFIADRLNPDDKSPFLFITNSKGQNIDALPYDSNVRDVINFLERNKYFNPE